MPGSVRHGKSDIKAWINKQSDIKKIVDVGAGSGTYAHLLEYKYDFVGIEIFPNYISRFDLRKYYSEIIIADVFTLAVNDMLPSGDCIIFGDVLEHLEKEKARFVLKKGVEDYLHTVLSIPLGEYPAAEHYGNKHEQHLASWEFEELEVFTDWQVAKKVKDIGIFMK